MRRKSPDPFDHYEPGFGSRVREYFGRVMSSKRRGHDDNRAARATSFVSNSEDEKPHTRAAWRANWHGNTHIVVQRRPFSTISGILLILYCVTFALIRFETEEGLSAMLYWTNSAVAIGAVGLLVHSGLLIGISVALVSASHMTFTYDLLSWMLFDRFALGRAIYLESDKDFSILSTTLHQFWYLPLVCCVVYCEYSGQLRLMKRYWIFSVILSFMLAFYAKTHFEEQRVVFGTPITFVPDFVMGHEMWTEELTLLHRFDDLPAFMYATYSCLISACALNGVCYGFLQIFFFLVLEGHGTIHKEKTT